MVNSKVSSNFATVKNNKAIKSLNTMAGRKKKTENSETTSKVDLGYTPSEYQQKIFDFVEHGQGNGVIEAFAGTGKTTTIVSALKFIPSKYKVLYLAFNKANAKDLEERTKTMSNVKVNTSHGLGYAFLCRYMAGQKLEINEYKYRTYLKHNIDELSSVFSDIPRKNHSVYFDAITNLINFGRFNIVQTLDEMKSVEKRYNISTIADECEVALKCMQWGKEHWQESVDFGDMLWIPVETMMDPKTMKYDFIFVDECQDIAVVTTRLFLKCMKRGGRLIAVGDSKQAIYGFAGASPEAFNYLRDYPNTSSFTLPVSYRCSKRVIKEAQEFVPQIQARPDADKGEVKTDCTIDMVKNGDMVLARTKTPLMTLYIKLLKENKAAYIKGADMGRELVRKIDAVSSDNCQSLGLKGFSEDGIIPRLFMLLFESRNKLMDRRGLDYHDATLSTTIIEMYDTIQTIKVLAATCINKNELVRKIENIFSDDKNDAICLSTVHKAKGFEADNVYILKRSDMPSKLAKEKWELEQEDNLIYIAITRARKTLGYIKDDEVEVDYSLNAEKELLSDLSYYEDQVCKLYNKQSRSQMKDEDILRKKVDKSEEIKPMDKSLRNTVSMSSKSKGGVKKKEGKVFKGFSKH